MKINIDTPCNEKWEEMTLQKENKISGRFCASCEKVVVDFTTMTNDEIIDFFKHKPENNCGHFGKKQLENFNNRTQNKNYFALQNWYKKTFFILSGIFLWETSQTKKLQAQGGIRIVENNKQIKDTITIKEEKKSFTIHGNIVDERGAPMPGVSIVIKNSTSGTSTDIDGNYQFTIKNLDILVYSATQYNNKEIITDEIHLKNQNYILNVVMIEEMVILDTIEINGYREIERQNFVGGYHVRTKSPNWFKRTWRKIKSVFKRKKR